MQSETFRRFLGVVLLFGSILLVPVVVLLGAVMETGLGSTAGAKLGILLMITLGFFGVAAAFLGVFARST
jgi:hypothetical protein